ncbi:hypothetical protein NXW75_09955 [Bacteroides xylanisolvens]|nr:hypothetical protein [Bacteroides xylanisolvens]
MRKVFFVGLIAILTGCSQESRVSSPEDSGIELQINLSLGSVSTRAVDAPITGNDGEGYVLPFTEVKTLKVDLYKSLEAAPIFTYTATDAEIAGIRNTATGKLARLSIPKIPVTTQYVKVTINRFKEENPLINQLQVSSQDDPPAPTMNRTEIPYEGVTKEIIVIPEESDPFSVKVKAIVEVAPVLSRFEIIPGEIVVTNPATTGASFGPDGRNRRQRQNQELHRSRYHRSRSRRAGEFQEEIRNGRYRCRYLFLSCPAHPVALPRRLRYQQHANRILFLYELFQAEPQRRHYHKEYKRWYLRPEHDHRFC